jgi:hypothetical protein
VALLEKCGKVRGKHQQRVVYNERGGSGAEGEQARAPGQPSSGAVEAVERFPGPAGSRGVMGANRHGWIAQQQQQQ